MKIKYILLSILSVAATISCTNYLDIKPYGRTIPKTAEEYGALLHNHLNKVDEGNDSYLVGDSGEILDFDACYGDDFEVCITSNDGTKLSKYIGDLIETSTIYNAYSNLYTVIRDCNLVIHEMEEKDTKEANQVYATAYAMRGVSYYQLIKKYCEVPVKDQMDKQLGVPLVLKFDMESKPNRASLKTIVDQIISDLDKSISYHLEDDIYRFTENVAIGYKARVYFWTKQWDKALSCARTILEKHPLLNDVEYKEMMKSRFELKGNQLLRSGCAFSLSGTINFNSAEKSVQQRPISKRFLNCFVGDEKENDVRYTLSVGKKRVCQKPFFAGMRSAEFKLIEAECLYHMGKTSDALNSINELRMLRIKNATPKTMDNLESVPTSERITIDTEGKPLTPLLYLILRERRKELFLEGDRFFELKRNGSPTFWVCYNGLKYTTQSYMYTFPLPPTEMELVENFKQNPGYTELVF